MCLSRLHSSTRDTARITAMHAYRTHSCGALRLADAGATARLSGWVHRKRDHGQLLFIDLRDHYGVTQCVIDSASPLFAAADALQARKRRHRHRQGGRSARPKRSIRSFRPARSSWQIAELALVSAAEPLPFPVNAEARLSRGDAAQVPLPRSAAREACTQYRAALPGHRLDPAAHDRAGLHRIPDADPDRELARRRARLSGAEPAPSRQVLCAAAGAAAIQAAPDGGRASTAISRSRRASATRRAAPTARPASSTSSISRCPS